MDWMTKKYALYGLEAHTHQAFSIAPSLPTPPLPPPTPRSADPRTHLTRDRALQALTATTPTSVHPRRSRNRRFAREVPCVARFREGECLETDICCEVWGWRRLEREGGGGKAASDQEGAMRLRPAPPE